MQWVAKHSPGLPHQVHVAALATKVHLRNMVWQQFSTSMHLAGTGAAGGADKRQECSRLRRPAAAFRKHPHSDRDNFWLQHLTCMSIMIKQVLSGRRSPLKGQAYGSAETAMLNTPSSLHEK